MGAREEVGDSRERARERARERNPCAKACAKACAWHPGRRNQGLDAHANENALENDPPFAKACAKACAWRPGGGPGTDAIALANALANETRARRRARGAPAGGD